MRSSWKATTRRVHTERATAGSSIFEYCEKRTSLARPAERASIAVVSLASYPLLHERLETLRLSEGSRPVVIS